MKLDIPQPGFKWSCPFNRVLLESRCVVGMAGFEPATPAM